MTGLPSLAAGRGDVGGVVVDEEQFSGRGPDLPGDAPVNFRVGFAQMQFVGVETPHEQFVEAPAETLAERLPEADAVGQVGVAQQVDRATLPQFPEQLHALHVERHQHGVPRLQQLLVGDGGDGGKRPPHSLRELLLRDKSQFEVAETRPVPVDDLGGSQSADVQRLESPERALQLHVEQDASQIENKGLDAFGRNGRNQDIHLLRV